MALSWRFARCSRAATVWRTRRAIMRASSSLRKVAGKSGILGSARLAHAEDCKRTLSRTPTRTMRASVLPAKRGARWDRTVALYRCDPSLQAQSVQPCSKRRFFHSAQRSLSPGGPKEEQEEQREQGQEKEQGQGEIRGPMGWKTVAVTAAVGSLLVAAYLREKQRKYEEARLPLTSVGQPLIGGPYTLHDWNGQTVTEKTFAGQYTLIYFGFTHCAEICPQELEKMGIALNLLDDMKDVGAAVQPIFITVDPKRDTPQQMKAYSKRFHPNIVWLSGTDEQLRDVTRRFRVYYSAPPEDTDDYQVDHSIYYYLMGRQGEFLEYFGKALMAEEVAMRMRNQIRQDLARQ